MAQALRRGDGVAAATTTNNASLFSDDFGGSAINASAINWQVLPGGQGAVAVGPPGAQTNQAAIGTGQNSGMTYAVGASALTVNMGTVNGDELWFLSTRTFAASEDVTVILSKSQALAANSIWFGLVEVDPYTGSPLLNPNLAGDFTNRGGIEFGTSTNSQQASLQALGDSSPVVASIVQNPFAPAAMTTAFETMIEFHAEDIIASATVTDGITGKLATALRVSSQVPNDTKVYKLLMRFRNTAAPATSTAVVIGRVLVCESQELRVEIASGRGDQNSQKAVAANITSMPAVAIAAGAAAIGYTNPTLGYTDSTTALGASATFTGTARATTTTTAAFSYFSATAYADQAGTLQIQQSLDSGATYQTVASVPVAAGSAASAAIRLSGLLGATNLYRVQFVNGATAQGTLRLSSAFTAN